MSKPGGRGNIQNIKKRIKQLFVAAFLVPGLVVPVFGEVEGYIIGPGDVLSIQVYGEPELSVDNVRVSFDGMIAYPLLGRLQVAGHTVTTLEKDVTLRLKQGYLNRPEVSVAIVGYKPFYVKGRVKSPGAHKYTEGMTVEQAIALSGGIPEGYRPKEVTLTRGDAEPIVVDPGFQVLPGDILTVDADEIEVVEESGKFVYLYGEVKKPGSFPFREGLTVEKAIVLAGGFTPRASKRKIDISREVEGEGTQKMKKVELTEPVQPGDVITVGESWF